MTKGATTRPATVHGELFMPASQDNITAETPMGANLTRHGATFRVWAPRAQAVYVCYDGHWDPEEPNLLVKDPRGCWAGYVAGIQDGTEYKYYVTGTGSRGYKRDPYAREISAGYPNPNCIVRDPCAYPWHDGDFQRPGFSDLVIYQLHVGTYYVPDARLDGG